MKNHLMSQTLLAIFQSQVYLFSSPVFIDLAFDVVMEAQLMT